MLATNEGFGRSKMLSIIEKALLSKVYIMETCAPESTGRLKKKVTLERGMNVESHHSGAQLLKFKVFFRIITTFKG